MKSSASQFGEDHHGRPVGKRMRERSDRAKQLVAAIQGGGDRNEGFRELFELYRRPIHAFFRRNGFSNEDRRDLAQETFLRAFQGIGGFRGESRFEAWLYEIARNVLRKAIRHGNRIKRKKDEVSLESLPVEPIGRGPALGRPAVSNPEDKYLDSERRELIFEEVKQMPPQMQRCYRLWAEGYPYSQIAELLGITIDGVRGHLGAAKARLKSRLGEVSDEAGN